MRPSKFYGMIVKIKNKITLFTLLAKNPHIYPSKFTIPLSSKYRQYFIVPVACGQGMQVMLCMTNKLLRADRHLLLNKEHHCFGTKLE